jgi:hypothetical protein
MAISGLSKAGKSLGSDWRELESDWEQVAEAAIWGRRAMRVLADLAGSDLDRLVDLRAKLARLVDQGKDLISDDGPIGIKAKALSEVLADLSMKLGAIRQLAGADETETFVDGTASDWLKDLSSRVGQWRADAPKLHGWCAWQKARSEAKAENLGPLVAGLEGGEMAPDDTATVFEGIRTLSSAIFGGWVRPAIIRPGSAKW